MDATERIQAYYATLRRGESPAAYFPTDGAIVKFGISETLVGGDAVRQGLVEQTRTTEDWTVESEALRVSERENYAWFSDAVRMAWTDRETGTRRDFDTRWSGTLERRDEWLFVGMHVSVADEI